MARIEWKNLTFGVKEVVSACIFIFTISGVWYKIYYVYPLEHENDKAAIKQIQDDFKDYQKKMEQRVRVLEDDKTARDAVYKAGMHPDTFYPMTKVKSK